MLSHLNSKINIFMPIFGRIFSAIIPYNLSFNTLDLFHLSVGLPNLSYPRKYKICNKLKNIRNICAKYPETLVSLHQSRGVTPDQLI